MNSSLLDSQLVLSDYYRTFLGDPAGLVTKQAHIKTQREVVESIEDSWCRQQESQVDFGILPSAQAEFLKWYKAVERQMNNEIRHFIEYMKCTASVEQVAYYICMEELVDGSFDDLMAVAQLGMPVNCKMVAGENYWDEMGNGDHHAVHTTMFRTSSQYMRKTLSGSGIEVEPNLECLMNGNVLLMWAVRREYNMRLIGAMGLVEGSAPERFSATTKAMERLALPEEVIAYHKAHIKIDARHSRAWYEGVLKHYSGCGEDVVRELALGVAIRYRVAMSYYNHMYETMRGMK